MTGATTAAVDQTAAAGSGLPAAVSSLIEELTAAWGAWGPTLTPDASRVAYLSDQRGKPELWVRDIDAAADGSEGVGSKGKAARVIELSADPVVSVHWSPDSQWLACAVATGGGVRTQIWVVRPDGTDARKVAGSDTVHATLGPWARRGHRLVVGLASQLRDDPIRCDLIDPATGVHEPLAVGDLVEVLDLSADERYVLLRDGERGAQFCVMVDRELDIHHRMLPFPDTGSTDIGKFRPSPPGDADPLTVYFVTDAGRPRRELVAQAVTATGERGPAGILASREDAELELLDADATGRLLALVWNCGGGSELELFDTVTGERRLVSQLPGSVVSHCVLSRDGRRAVLAIEGPTSPRALWNLDTASLELSQLTEPSPVPTTRLVQPSLETLVAHDGLPLTGWLYRAPGAPGPAMLSLHGGPEAQERPTFNPQHQVMVAAGISVFAPNVRGSSGFGHAFVHADDRFGRYDAIADVASCAQHLIASGVADPARIAVTGRSYGGYLTLAALTKYPQLFSAGVDICGMSDLPRFYRDTEPWIAAAAVSKYGHPVYDASLLHALSPLNYAADIVAPLLVVHGELDTNVPIGQAHDIVAALTELGRPVDYLQLDGEGHEYRRVASRRVLLQRLALFLLQTLG
jgi:dipeptidyl aminopeptidase/acylaminoacyl peptidase